ncbi:hypothetical protein L1049_002312 [Liquidambar formosana]|uniref:Uncharacterized protein n=1 Tax=Liquidambar formosana TaxID=63359 RepID=A0AAP0NFD5_LIQFO
MMHGILVGWNIGLLFIGRGRNIVTSKFTHKPIHPIVRNLIFELRPPETETSRSRFVWIDSNRN